MLCSYFSSSYLLRPCIVGERFKDILADITREGLLEPLLLHLVAQQSSDPPPPPALNFLLRPTTPISPSLTRAGRSFPELTRLSAAAAEDDEGDGDGVAGGDDEEKENADGDGEMRGYGIERFWVMMSNLKSGTWIIYHYFSRRNRSVTIHVCDGSRNTKKDFVCNQDLLLSQMGYFRWAWDYGT